MSLIICKTISEIRELVSGYKRENKTIGFVPTMGYLHEGHLSLIDIARERSDILIASIFVNPAQFNNAEDLEKYPRDEKADLNFLKERNVQAVYMPDPESLYTSSFQTWVDTTELTKEYEGAFRPGHFKGVTTVLTVLFNLIQPDCAAFGEKDFQQLRVVERMVEDLKFPIEILRGETLREPDGLAMSSRNVRLSEENRAKALNISAALNRARDLFSSGERDSAKTQSLVQKHLSGVEGIELEYVAVVNEDLEEIKELDSSSRVLVAASLGGVRLIDNCALEQ